MIVSALDHALRQVDPAVLVKRAVSFDSELTVTGIRGEKIVLQDIDDIYVVGAGKACARMAGTLSKILGHRLTQGAITIPHDENETFSRKFNSSIKVTRGAHPVPDNSGLEGSRRIIEVLAKATAADLVFVLISGGGSALLPLPAPGINLEDKQDITNRLLRSGAAIQEVNTVRKHLSAIKGGQLLRYINGARVVSLILSDVIDDDMSSIASGPTYPDSTTFADALAIVKKYRVAGRSDRASGYLVKGARGLVNDTPKPDDNVFKNVHNVLIGNNEVACTAAVKYLRRHGVNTVYLGSRFAGEARAFGRFLAHLTSDLTAHGRGSFAIVLGGETTVKIKGSAGIGGRNQEAALACATAVPSGTLVACMGTDGIDGSSDAAGALVSETSRLIAKRKKIDLERYLDRHDSYHALGKINSLIFTGRTGTNVNDIAIIYSAG